MKPVIRRSIVLTAFFPESAVDPKAFQKALQTAADCGADVVEFWYSGPERQLVKQALQRFGGRSIYLGAILAKREGYCLCSIDPEKRICAVRAMKQSIDEAAYFGSEGILINGGRRPLACPDEGTAAMDALKESLIELTQYAEKQGLYVTLEHGDTAVESFELIGTSTLVCQLKQEMEQCGVHNLRFTMDTSHLRQLGENCETALTRVADFCTHVHLTNCWLQDPSDPRYGDKHPAFGVPGGELDEADAETLWKSFPRIFAAAEELIVAQEIKCAEQNKYDAFWAYMEQTPWFLSDHRKGVVIL